MWVGKLKLLNTNLQSDHLYFLLTSLINTKTAPHTHFYSRRPYTLISTHSKRSFSSSLEYTPVVFLFTNVITRKFTNIIFERLLHNIPGNRKLFELDLVAVFIDFYSLVTLGHFLHFKIFFVHFVRYFDCFLGPLERERKTLSSLVADSGYDDWHHMVGRGLATLPACLSLMISNYITWYNITLQSGWLALLTVLPSNY